MGSGIGGILALYAAIERLEELELQKLSKCELVFRVVQYAVRKGATPDDLAAIMPQHRRNSLWRSSEAILSSEDFVAAVTGIGWALSRHIIRT